MIAVDSLNCNEVIECELLVLGILDDELSRDGTVIDKGKRSLLLRVDFGKLEVDDGLEQLNDGTSEVSLH